jgi:hypothetical protein
MQVSVEVYLECPPAPLEQFRGLIAENYVNGDKFQVRRHDRLIRRVSGAHTNEEQPGAGH